VPRVLTNFGSSHYQAEATNQGLVLTPQLLEKMHETAHRKAVIVRETREQERATARRREHAAQRERQRLNGHATT